MLTCLNYQTTALYQYQQEYKPTETIFQTLHKIIIARVNAAEGGGDVEEEGDDDGSAGIVKSEAIVVIK